MTILGNTTAFAWRDRGKPRKTLIQNRRFLRQTFVLGTSNVRGGPVWAYDHDVQSEKRLTAVLASRRITIFISKYKTIK